MGDDGGPDDQVPSRKESVSEPAKVMRIGSMIKQLLEELRNTEAPRAEPERLRSIHATGCRLAEAPTRPAGQARVLRPALRRRGPDRAAVSRVAQAQLVGWLEGLFQGIQLTLFSQQMAAWAQLENMREQALAWRRAPRGCSGTYL